MFDLAITLKYSPYRFLADQAFMMLIISQILLMFNAAITLTADKSCWESLCYTVLLRPSVHDDDYEKK